VFYVPVLFAYVNHGVHIDLLIYENDDDDDDDDIFQMLREKCLQLEDDVHLLNDKLKEAHNVIAERDCLIQVCNSF